MSRYIRFAFAASLVKRYRPVSVIDYGCGNGALFSLIHDDIEKGIGIEVRDFLTDLENKFHKVPNIQFYSIEQAERLSNIRADIVFCTEVMEHVVDVPTILDTLKKYVSDNGIIILSVPNEIGLAFLIKSAVRGIAGLFDIGGYRYYQRYAAKDFLKMVFAREDTRISRRSYDGVYMHTGFNWRHFKKHYIDDHFNIVRMAGTPVGWPGYGLSSQIWFILKKRPAVINYRKATI